MADATRFQVKSKQIDEHKQATDASATQMEKLTQSQAQIDKLVQSQQKMVAMMAALMSQSSGLLGRPPDPQYSASGDLTSYPQAPQPPDPPDFNRLRQNPTIKDASRAPDYNPSLTSKTSTNKKLRLRYSCEEIYERMENGFCIFCEDLDTPGHYNLKHKGSKLCLVESVGDESPDDEKPGEAIVEEIANKPVDMIQEKESNPENESRPEVSHQVPLSQSKVAFSSLEHSHRCHNHYASLDVSDKDMGDEPVCDKDGDSIVTMSAKFCETYEEPQFELMCLKQSHDSVENYLGSFEYALTRSSLQQTPSYQYRAPFNPYQSYNDQPLDTTRHNNLSNEMAASLGLVGGDDQEDDTKFARMKIVKKNNSETKIKFSSSNHPCFVALVSTSNLHKDTLSFPKDFTTSNGVKRECGGIVLTDKGDRAWALELRFNQVGNGKILVLSLCPAEKASKESFPVEVMHRINQMNAAGYSPNEKNVYTLTSGLCQVKRDYEAVRVLEKLMQSEFSLDLLDCSSLTCLFCEPKLGVEVTVLLNQMLLLGYHGLEMQVLSCLQEFGEGSKTDTRIWKKLASFLWFLHGKKLLVMGVKQLTLAATKFHLKHKWRSRLEFCVKTAILFTSSVKLLFPKNHKLLHYEVEFCAQYNDLKQLSTEFQSFPAGHTSSGLFSVGDVYGFFTCSKLQTGDETQEKLIDLFCGVHGFVTQSKRLLVLDEIPLLNNDNKGDITIKASWCYHKPMIREVFHLQRPPEVIDLHGNLDFITKVIVHWKEHPPDQFSEAFMGKYSCFHP